MKILTMISGLILFFTVSSGQAKILIWTSASDGDWGAAANWTPHNVPGIGDTAIVTNSGTFTVTLNADVTVDTLTLGATNGVGTQAVLLNGRTLTVSGQGTVTSSGSLTGGTLAGNWAYSSANLSGALTLATNSVLNLVSDTASTNYFSSLALTNHGTVNWSNVDFSATSASQIQNYGLWNAQMNNAFTSSSGQITFNNQGIFRKSGGLTSAGSSYFDNNTVFNNYSSGTVEVQIGIVLVSQMTDGGIIDVSANALFSSAGCFLTGSPTFTGAGRVTGNLVGGNAAVNGLLTVTNITLSGTLTLASNSVLNVIANVAGSTAYFSGLTLTNYGTVNWSNVNLIASSGSQIYISNYGLWDCQNNDAFSASSGSAVFNNYGVFRKSGDFITVGSSRFDINTLFNNYGRVDVQGGGVSFNQVSDSGTINVATNSVVSLGVCFLTGSPVFGGSGYVGGLLSGGNAVLNGVMILTNAALVGTLTIASNAVLNFAATNSLGGVAFGGVLTNYGTVYWNNIGLRTSSTSQIYNYGLWDAQRDNQFTGSATFNNYGTFRKSGSVGPVGSFFDYNVYFNNWPSGTVDIQNGTAYFSQTTDGGTVNTASNAMFSSAGCFLTGTPVFSGAGKVNGNVYGGFALVNGVLNLTNATLGGTLTLASNAVMNLTNDMFATVTFSGLTLTNYGTVNWAGVMLTASSSSQIENYGLWDSRQDDLMTGSSGTTTFNNHSVFRKSGESSFGGPTYFDSYIYFNNYPEGTVDIQNGTAYFSQTTDGGTVNTVSNSMFSSAGCFLTGSPVFGGAGKVNGNFYGGFALVNGVLNLTNATLGGTLTLASNAVMNLTNDMFATVTFSGLTLTNFGTV
ncbi:MAG TPA: hypothetical protein VL863_08835, partial [bacterium]|nr:hypothetical protein [bacterium]